MAWISDGTSMDEEIAQIVRDHGWYAANISGGQQPFFYTVGLMETFHHPEFIIFGLKPQNAFSLIAGLVRDLRTGRRYVEPGIFAMKLGEVQHQIGFRRVDSTQHPLYLGFVMGFLTNFGRIGDLEAIQVFWPDSDGKFPFEKECNPSVWELQPLLARTLTPREIRDFERRWK